MQTENYAHRREAAAALHALCAEMTSVHDETQNPLDVEETALPEGTALSPRDAARCVLDFARTAGFLKGVRAAIIEAQHRFPDQTLHVLYAGCGPFAPLMIPLTTEFRSAQVQFTLLDIHQRSLDAARKIVVTLGLTDFVRDYVRADAVSYQQPPESAPHIVVAETMQRALAKEPQVAVTCNLAAQLIENGIMIPQRISLSACLANLNKEIVFTEDEASPETRRQRIYLGEIFELTAESSRRVRDWPTAEEMAGARSSPAVRLRVPQLDDESYKLMILTDITVFDNIVIGEYDAGVTYPAVLDDVGRIESGMELEFYYLTGERPGLRYKIL